MVRPKNEIEVSSVSITKNCGTPIKQIHRKPEQYWNLK